MKQQTLILHVGMDKTGSSAIQYFLNCNRKKLLEDIGLCYPTVGLWSDFSHHPFAFATVGINGYSQKDLHKLFPALMEEVSGSTSVLVSSECLFKSTKKEGFSTFYELITRHFKRIKIIIYVRRQDEWVESRHKHSILSGRELSLEMLSRPHFCDYKQFIDLWADYFGINNVIVRAFEKTQFEGGSIFSDIASLVGLNSIKDCVIPDSNINTSLGNVETYVKSLCNEIGFLRGGVDTLNRILIEHSVMGYTKRNEKYLLSPSERLNLISKYSKTNSSIANEYLGRKDGKLFLNDLPSLEDDSACFTSPDNKALSDIGSFIRDTSPNLYRRIKAQTRSALKSNDDGYVNAGRKLSYLFDGQS